MDDLTLGHHLADQSEAVRVRGDQQARSPRWPVGPIPYMDDSCDEMVRER
jgi:hypothetical protein